MTPALPEAQRILAIHVTRIGDTVMTTPALRAIAQAWPQARLTFLGHPKRAEVIAHLPFVSEVGTITKRSAQVRGRLGGLLSGKKWDLGFVFGFDEALVRFALRTCKQVVAFRQKDARINQRLFKLVEPAAHNSEHGVDQLLRLPAALGITAASRALAYQPTPQETAWAQQRLGSEGITSGGAPLVGFVIESFPTKPYRDWDVAHFGALAQRIVDTYPAARFVLLGGHIQADKVVALANLLAERITVLAGRLSLRETAAIMTRLDLYVGVDTGPSHIAGALQVPMVVMYHCKHPSRCLAPPEHPQLSAIDHPDVDSERCTEHSSLSLISVDRVWEAARALLAERKS
jgi:heptosyltransferase-3